MCNRNRDIRKRQIISHIGGAMSLSKRRNNLVFVGLYCALYFNILQFSPHYTYIIVEHIEN